MSPGVRAMAPVADYLTINISSPNTPGLRELQDEGALRRCWSRGRRGARRGTGRRSSSRSRPISSEGDPERIVRAAIDHRIDALIVANTTVSRPPLKSRHRGEAGGLSGAPLKPLALERAARFPARRAAARCR